PVQVSVQASDQDVGDVVTLNAAGVPQGATLNPLLPTTGNPVSSLLSWTPTVQDAGDHVITFSATDQQNQQALCGVTIHVSSTCGNGIVEPSAGEVCDGGACCGPDCHFATGVCRSAAGACDVAESCSG